MQVAAGAASEGVWAVHVSVTGGTNVVDPG